MKKQKMIPCLLLTMLALTACSTAGQTGESADSSQKNAVAQTSSTSQASASHQSESAASSSSTKSASTSSQSPASSSTASSSSETSASSNLASEEMTTEQAFKDSDFSEFPVTASTDKEDITIKSVKRATNKVDGSDMLMIEISYTNKGKDSKTPYDAFMNLFQTVQYQDGVAQGLGPASTDIYRKDLSFMTDDKRAKTGMTSVAPGESLDDALLMYTLNYPTDVGFIPRSTLFTENSAVIAWKYQ